MKQKTPKCEKCSLKCNTHNNEAGWGNPKAPLAIVLDCPGDLLAEKLLVWTLRRLGLSSDDVWVDYLVKCPLPKGVKKDEVLLAYKTCWNHIIRQEIIEAKAVVVAGNWGTKFLNGKDMKEVHGRRVDDTGIWVCYSFKYLLMNPAECVDNWRVIFKAAEEAGLNPKMTIGPNFDFPSRKLV